MHFGCYLSPTCPETADCSVDKSPDSGGGGQATRLAPTNTLKCLRKFSKMMKMPLAVK